MERMAQAMELLNTQMGESKRLAEDADIRANEADTRAAEAEEQAKVAQTAALAATQQALNLATATAASAQAAAASSAQRSGSGTEFSKLLKQPEHFTWEQEKWESWKFRFTSWVVTMSPTMPTLLTGAESSVDPMDKTGMTPEQQELCTQLYAVLVMLMSKGQWTRLSKERQEPEWL